MTALIGSKSRITAAAATASATGSTIAGYEPANVLNPRLSRTWKAPKGGPHTLTITLTVATSINILAIVCPAGRPISGNATIVIKNASAVVQFSGALAAYTVDGSPDRRFLPIYTFTSAKTIEITVESDSEIGYVYAGYGTDLSSALRTDWQLSIASVAPVRPLAGRDFVWRATDRTSPIRAKRFTGNLEPLSSSQAVELWSRFSFTGVGAIEPILWLPRAVDTTTASSGLIEAMHRTGIYGRMDREFRLELMAQSADSPLWRSRLGITEAL